MLSERYVNCPLHRKKTSGSTGVPVEVLVDEAAQQFKRACTLRIGRVVWLAVGRASRGLWGNPQVRTDWKGRLRRSSLGTILRLP